MNKKTIIIGIVVVILVIIIAAGFLFLTAEQEVTYTKSNISSSCSIDLINNGNITTSTMGKNIHVFNETKYGVTIISYNTANSTLSSISDMITFTTLRDSYKLNTEQATIANKTCYLNKDTGVYLFILENTGTFDNVLIITKDKNILEHTISSITT